jgi:hypothetical protein
MFDSKFIATLFAVAISVIAICNINTNKITSNEGYAFGGMPSTTTRIQKCVANSWDDYHKGNIRSVPIGDMEKLPNKNTTNITPYSSSGLGQTAQDYEQQVEKFTNEQREIAKDRLQRLNVNQGTNGMNKGEFFSTANWETTTPPRFENSGQGPITRVLWNEGKIDPEHMAVPVENPLAWAGMVSNGYSGANGNYQRDNFVEPYVMEKSLMMPNYSEGNYNSLAGGDLMATSDLFPVQNMSALNGVDKNGQPTQCVFFDRIIHSNRNNRRRSQGDPIRGDLPIAPMKNDGWFKTSFSFEDLQQGALGVLGGQSESSIRLAEFIKASGSSKTTIGGIDTSIDTSIPTQKSLSTNQQMNTVQVSR